MGVVKFPTTGVTTMDILANRMRPLTTSIFTELAQMKHAVRAAGKDIIDLSVGSPDLPPSADIIEALVDGVRDVQNYGYAITSLHEFQAAVASFYKSRYGVSLDPQREVLQVIGSQDGLAHLTLATVNPGDVVLVPDPGYPIYQASVQLASGVLYPMPLLAENDFLPDLAAIPREICQRAKLMILNYPGNPVPKLATRKFFRDVVSFAQVNDILVIHDFAYSELVFDGRKPTSFLSIDGARQVGIEFNSLSKTFNLAGARIGYAVGHPGVLAALAQLKSNIDYGVFLPIQRAAIVALTGDPALLTDQAHTYEARRDALCDALDDIGWRVQRPSATMFLWAKLPLHIASSHDFAMNLLERTGVAVTPGRAFGSCGEGYLRIALVKDVPILQEAARRIGTVLR